MSILRYKRMLLADGGVARGGDGGGGGGGQPTTSTAYNTNVPEYARPYVENMLQSTQKQIYNDDMTSFRPYQPYSQDVNNYFAGYSPMQKQAQYETANMQTPGQYGVATGLTGLGAMGSMGAGANYANNVTNPSTMQSYMNPYQQGVTDVAKNAAVREAQMAENANKLSSARQGTYGGARQALGSIERERNLLSNLSNIQAQGSNQAYNQALQSQQFGANLGLQGYGQAMQGGSQLANIGGQQQAADLARIGAQNQMGAQQQAFEQQKVNQAISNYATAQQYPFMQLGIMNSMLRGLPLQQTTTATYQQQPSTTQQLAGFGGAAMSYLGKKEGGVIGMKEGGAVPGYKYGDLISDPQLQSMSQNLSPQQLQGRIADQQVTPNERGIFQGTQQAQQRMASNPMAAQQMAQAAPPPQMAQAPSADARMGGIAQAGGDMFNTMGYAGGGIIAFDEGGDVPFAPLDENGNVMPLTTAQKKERDAEKKAPTKTTTKPAAKEPAMSPREASIVEQRALLEKYGVKSGPSEADKSLGDIIAKQQSGLGDVIDAKERANQAKAFLQLGKNPRGFGAGAIDAAESYLTGAGEIAGFKQTQELALGKANAEHAAGIQARARGDIEAANKHFDKEAEIKKDLQIAAGNNAATMASAGATQRYAEEQIKRIQAEYKAKTGKDLSYEDAIKRRTEASTTAADSNETRAKIAAESALNDWKKSVMFTEEWIKMTPDEKLKAEQDKYKQIYGRLSGNPNATTAAAPAPVQNQDGTVTIPGKGTFKKLPNGNYAPV